MYIKQTLDWFKRNRPNLYDAALRVKKHIFSNQKTVGLHGPLKVGKRNVFEILALLMPEYKFVYVISLNRRDMEAQLEELEAYDIITIGLAKSGSINEIPEFDSNKKYVVVYDENDYGDGADQQYDIFHQIYRNSGVHWIVTSATPYSFICAMEDEIPFETIIPPDEYHGLDVQPREIISEDAFLRTHRKELMGLSRSFKNSLTEWLKSGYNKFIVRDVNFNRNELEQLRNYIRIYQLTDLRQERATIKVTLVDKVKGYEWINEGDMSTGNWDGRELIVVKQTFTRGTETDIHPYLFGYYDNRADKSAMNTVLQALGRFCSYRKNNHIKFFLTKEAFNMINAHNYMEKALQGSAPRKEILMQLAKTYNIKKLSKNTKIKGYNSSQENTWNWIKMEKNPGELPFCKLSSTAEDGTNRRTAVALNNNSTPDGNWVNISEAKIIIENMKEAIDKARSQTLKEYLKRAQEKYSIPDTGVTFFIGKKVAQPQSKIEVTNNSMYNNHETGFSMN